MVAWRDISPVITPKNPRAHRGARLKLRRPGVDGKRPEECALESDGVGSDGAMSASPHLDRRGLLRLGAASSLGFALSPIGAAGPLLARARARVSRPTPSRWAWRRAIRIRAASCSGRGSRRALEPGGGLAPERIDVQWELAADESFSKVVARGVAPASPQLGHSVHVEVDGLEPDRWYWYRFRAGDAESPIGRTRTLPAPDAAVDRMRLAVTSCQNFEQGLFTAYEQMMRDEPDLVLHLGDYIYEYRAGQNGKVRTHQGEEIRSLDDYRIRYGPSTARTRCSTGCTRAVPGWSPSTTTSSTTTTPTS